MANGLAYLNEPGQALCLDQRNDAFALLGYIRRMAKPMYDWYLAQWLRSLGKRQADIVRDLDWNKARVSLMIRGKQPYDRDAINELADYLNLAPYELLMHPDQAMAIRSMRKDALRVVETGKALDRDRRSGTNG